MAIFQGDELVDVEVNGRTMKLPATVANQLQLPQPAASAPAPVMGGELAPPALETPAPAAPAPAFTPEDTADLQAAKQQVDAAPIPAPPVPEPAKAAVPAKPQKPAPAGPAPTPVDKAMEEGDAARSMQAQATVNAANLESAGQLMIADEFHKRNEAIGKRVEKLAKDEADSEREHAAVLADIDTTKKKIAGTKIDRTADHPILAALSIALGGIGTAMNGQDVNNNPAWNSFWKALDHKVAGQMADLDQLHKVYGMKKEEVQQIRDKRMDRRAMHQMLISAEAEKAARTVEEMVARTTSETVKQNGLKMAGELRERGANAQMEAGKFQMEFTQRAKQHKDQLGLGYSQLAETKRSNKADEQLKREGMYLDHQAAMAAAQAKGGEAAAKARLELIKENETRGIRNTVTGDQLLTPKGRNMVAEADTLEAQAKTMEAMPTADGNQKAMAQALRDKASALRGEANITEAVRHRDPTQAGKLSDTYAAVQSMTGIVDRIQQIYDGPDGGKSYLSTSAGQTEIKSLMVQATMAAKDAHGLGVLSKADAELVATELQGGKTSPIDGWTIGNLTAGAVGADPLAFRRALESVIDTAQSKTWYQLKGTNFGGTKDELFKRRTDAKPTAENKATREILQDKTPGEFVKGGEKGAIRKAGEAVVNAPRDTVRAVKSLVTGDDYKSTADAQREAAENSGSAKRLGFSEPQAKHFDDLLSAYKTGDSKAKQRATEKFVGLATSGRDELALATLRNLREEAPDLYSKVKASLPEPTKDGETSVRGQLDYEDKAKAALPPVDLSKAKGAARNVVTATETNMELGQKAVIGDDASFEALSRRAAEGNTEAATILKSILGRRNR